MSFYHRAADQLLSVVTNQKENNFFNFLGYEGYVFEYMKDYSGLMARVKVKHKKDARSKQGLFDIRGFMNGQKLTHHQLFSDLLKYSNLRQCGMIWRGEIPEFTNDKERHALITLAMLMFEQEINFGNESFQRKSWFSPNVEKSTFKRPRDLLMGYIWYMFENKNVDCLKKFENDRGLLLPPNDPKVKKEFFNKLINSDKVHALMTNNYNNYSLFLKIASNSKDNPNTI